MGTWIEYAGRQLMHFASRPALNLPVCSYGSYMMIDVEMCHAQYRLAAHRKASLEVAGINRNAVAKGIAFVRGLQEQDVQGERRAANRFSIRTLTNCHAIEPSDDGQCQLKLVRSLSLER